MTSPIPQGQVIAMRGDPHRRLLRALLRLASEAGATVAGSATIVRASHMPWASATFQGMRHLIELALHGPDAAARAETLSAILPDAEFSLPGHIVADIAIDGMSRDPSGAAYVLRLSALTIESW